MLYLLYILLIISNNVLTSLSKPNVLLIILDDLGIGDLNQKYVQFPNINKLFTDGANFTNTYAGYSTCTPSRASIFTGKRPSNLGIYSVNVPVLFSTLLGLNLLGDQVRKNKLIYENYNWDLLKKYDMLGNNKFISDILSENDYYNYYLGKWDFDSKPTKHGFNYTRTSFGAAMNFYNKNNASAEYVDNPLNYTSDKFVRYSTKSEVYINDTIKHVLTNYMTDYLSEETIKLITKHNYEKPFFLTLSYTSPHNPYQSLKSDYDSITIDNSKLNYSESYIHNLKVYLAMIKAVDRGIGNILNELENINQLENTLIIFVSDNGGTHIPHLNHVNFPYKGWKTTFFEGGIRVPMTFYWKNHIEPSVYFHRVSHVDIFFSIIDLCLNMSITDTDGYSVFNNINRSIFYKSLTNKALIYDNKKIIISEDPNKVWMYDLLNDPNEENNLIMLNSTKDEFNELFEIMDSLDKESKKPLWNTLVKVPIPIINSKIYSLDDEFTYVDT